MTAPADGGARALMQRLNRDYDPTDADGAMTVAARALKILRVCERVLFAENAGMRVGRDDARELAVKMIELGTALDILEPYPTGAQVDAFHRALAIEAGLGEAPAPAAIPAEAPEARCLDCGKTYEDFPMDVILPRPQWLEIHPDEHGLLCAACIVTRAAKVPRSTCCHLIIEVAPPSRGQE